jgi:RND family efflux transporter MFP subunit
LVARHTVVAPFDGVVVAKLAEVGEWVESGTPVLELVGTERLRLDVHVPQEQFAAIDLSTPASIRIDAIPNKQIDARIAAKVPVSDPAARTFLVRLLIPDATGIIAGMSAEALFAQPGGGGLVEIPSDAVTRYPDGSTSIWVVEADGDQMRAHEKKVLLNRSIGARVVVREGLGAGTKVVVRGNEILQEGAVVRLVEPTADTGVGTSG